MPPPWAAGAACVPPVQALLCRESFVASGGASECSGLAFASDALWSPRSPRCIDAAHGWRTSRRGPVCRQAGGGLHVPSFPFKFAAPVPNHTARRDSTSSRYSEPQGRASRPCLPLRGMTGEPRTGDKPPRRQERTRMVTANGQSVETRCGDKVLERSTHLNPLLNT